MCGSSIETSTSSPTLNGSARCSISSRPPLSTTTKVSSGRASPPSKWNCLPVSFSSSASPESGFISSAATSGLTRTRKASAFLRLGVVLDEVREVAHDGDRDRLLRGDDALALADRARLGQDLAHAVGDVLARHLDEPERRDLDHIGLGAVLVERGPQRLQHLVAVLGPRHVDEVDDDDPADVAHPQLAHDLLGRLDVDLRDRVLEPALAAAGERARVDVDDRQRFRVVDHEIAARGQVDAAAQHGVERLDDVPLLEQLDLLLGAVVELDGIGELGRGALRGTW